MKGMQTIPLVLSLFSIGFATADLNDLGNGLVEDTDQQIYWLKDANLYVTACIAAASAPESPEKDLWNAFDPESLPNSSGLTKELLCSPYHGAMNWYEAEAWVSVLNEQNYLGFNDWRQPETVQPDASCEAQIAGLEPLPDQGLGYNCQGSELGYLFNVSLQNPNHEGNGATGGTIGNGCLFNLLPLHCFEHTDPFVNPQKDYWSGTSYAADLTRAWRFFTINGAQLYTGKTNIIFVWPVRAASSALPIAVPIMPTWWLYLLSILMGLTGYRWLNRHDYK